MSPQNDISILDHTILLDLAKEGAATGSPDDALKRIAKLLLRKLNCISVSFFDSAKQDHTVIIPLHNKNVLPDQITTSVLSTLDSGLLLEESSGYHYKLHFGDAGAFVLHRTAQLQEYYLREISTVLTSLHNSYRVLVQLEQSKQNEAASRSELSRFELLESFLQNTQDSFQVANADGKVVFMNKTAQQRLGVDWNPEMDLFVGEFELYFKDREAWQEHIIHLRKVKNLKIESHNVNMTTGKVTPVEVSVTLQEIGGREYVVAILRDITERKRFEREIEAREQMLLSASKATYELLHNQDVTQGIRAATQLVGASSSADRCYLFQQFTDDEGAPRYSQIAEWSRVPEISEEHNPELQGRTEDDLRFLLEELQENACFNYLVSDIPDQTFREHLQEQLIHAILILPIIHEGKLWGFMGFDNCRESKPYTEAEVAILKMCTDSISRALTRENYERQLYSLAQFPEQNPHPVLRADRHGQIMMQNKSSHGIETIEQNGRSFSLPEFVRKVVMELDSSSQNLISNIQIGTQYFNVFLSRLDTQEVNFYFSNITEQKKNEHALILAKEEAENAEKNKENFIASVTHEMRTPLNSILAFANELKKKRFDVDTEELIELLNTSGNHLLSIVNNILDLSKISAGKFEIVTQPFSFDVISKELVSILSPISSQKKLSFEVDLDPSLAKGYLGDGLRIKQVLLNFLHNSLKFTEKGGVKLSVHLENTQGKEHQVKIEVSDTGIGMSEAFKQELFTKFSQDQASDRLNIQGTGLGMVISRELVHLMGGSVAVESQLRAGTNITMHFQLEPTHYQANGDEEILVADFTGKKVLVVDDYELNHIVIRKMLQHYNLSPISVLSGSEAIDMVQKMHFDAILMDYNMPEMNGIEATRHIKEVLKLEVPIIALSAVVHKSQIQACYDSGMVDFIAKPFKETELVRKLKHYMLGQEDTQEIEIQNPVNSEQQQLYTLEDFVAMAEGDTQFIAQLVQTMIVNFQEFLVHMKEAAGSRDAVRLKQVAHKNKSPLLMIKAETIRDSLMALNELNGDSEPDWKAVDTHVQHVSKVVDLIVKDLVKQHVAV